MPVITKRRRCFICNQWMEEGETFMWETLRSHGIDRSLPIHPEHSPEYQKRQQQLAEAKEAAAKNGAGTIHEHIEGEYFMADQSMIRELANAIAQGEMWGQTHISVAYLKSLLRKHEIRKPGTPDELAKQPGEWSIRGGNVEAIQHDGTDEGANAVVQWINDHGGVIIRRFSEYAENGDDTDPYLRIESPRKPDVVGPTWWVVKTADGMFYTMPDSDFHTIYVPREA